MDTLDIPNDVMRAARECAGPDDAIPGVTLMIARAILAERERCAATARTTPLLLEATVHARRTAAEVRSMIAEAIEAGRLHSGE